MDIEPTVSSQITFGPTMTLLDPTELGRKGAVRVPRPVDRNKKRSASPETGGSV